MSLVIKGINKPKEGEMVVIGIQATDAVIDTWETSEIDGEDVFVKREHIKHADIIQIPEEHGDIKDINTFVKDKSIYECIENDVFNKKYTYLVGVGAIYNAPTILEAEE